MLQAPNIVRGQFYPTKGCPGCPLYSKCLVTSKCQNYDRHSLQCNICESRVRPAVNLGGLLPEGELQDDVQLALKVIQTHLNSPMAHPDSHTPNNSVNIAEQQHVAEASDIMGKFTERSKMTVEDAYTQVDGATGDMLSDLIV